MCRNSNTESLANVYRILEQYWSQKHTQNGYIYFTKLDVYAETQSGSISLSFYPNTCKVENIKLLPLPPSQLVRTGTIVFL